LDYDTFNALTKKRQEHSFAILTAKSKGYGRDLERLHQFKEVGIRKHETPELALHGMAEKHNLSVFDAVRDIERGEYDYIDQKWIDDKITDSINYLHMLEALIVERLMRDDLVRDHSVVSEGDNER